MRLTLVLCSMSADLARTLKHYAQFKPICLSMQQLLEFGEKHHPPKESYLFLRKELPARMANIMEEMSFLPSALLDTSSVCQIRDWYDLSFKELVEFAEVSPDQSKILERYLTTLNNVKNRHSSVVETMAEGVKEMRRQLVSKADVLDAPASGLDEATILKLTSTFSTSALMDEAVHYFLNRFYMNRIGVNMLIETHLSLFSKKNKMQSDDLDSSSTSESSDDDDQSDVHNLVGTLDPRCDVVLIAKNAFEDARDLCYRHYGGAADCTFTHYDQSVKGKKVKMTYVPSHLYHMLFELFKNALKAVWDRYRGEGKIPNIECLISKGMKDVIIKISDRGRGIARTDLANILQFQCSSSLPPPPPSDETVTASPLSGYGYGLPLSRLYAKYFSGDLWLNSIEGYGTDAMIALKARPQEALEVLPLMSKTASGHYVCHVQAADWSDSRHFRRHNHLHD